MSLPVELIYVCLDQLCFRDWLQFRLLCGSIKDYIDMHSLIGKHISIYESEDMTPLLTNKWITKLNIYICGTSINSELVLNQLVNLKYLYIDQFSCIRLCLSMLKLLEHIHVHKPNPSLKLLLPENIVSIKLTGTYFISHWSPYTDVSILDTLPNLRWVEVDQPFLYVYDRELFDRLNQSLEECVDDQVIYSALYEYKKLQYIKTRKHSQYYMDSIDKILPISIYDNNYKEEFYNKWIASFKWNCEIQQHLLGYAS